MSQGLGRELGWDFDVERWALNLVSYITPWSLPLVMGAVFPCYTLVRGMKAEERIEDSC